jgi:TetR/AcrR family transcriptional regulator
MSAASNSEKPRLGTRGQPEASRKAILQAALVEFSEAGLSGARMDSIAESAGVNKALLYYYFRDKDTLYAAVLDEFFARFLDRLTETLSRPASAGERFLSYVRAHFDTVAESPHYARIFVGEILRAGRGGSPHIERVFARYMQPIALRVVGVLQEGIASGEFRPVEPMQFMPSTVGTIVHYFAVAPMLAKFRPVDPFSPEALRQRRAAVLDFTAAALFVDRDAGVALAEQVASRQESQLIHPQSTALPKRSKIARRKAL